MKFSFLFGSGADTNVCNDLTSGSGFISSLLGLNDDVENLLKSINKINNQKYQLIYSSSNKIYIQTIKENDEKAKVIFLDTHLNIINKNLKDLTEEEKKTRESLFSFFYKILYEKSYENDEQIYNEYKNKIESIKDFFLENAVFFDTLDGKFNSLRFPNSNGYAKRVIYAYYRVFALMLSKLYPKEFNEINNENDIYNILNKPYSAEMSERSYYSILKENNLEPYVFTTNYTELSRIYTGIEDVVYLHGKLTWFEDLKKLTVFDCTKIEEQSELKYNDNIIPFIMIPSGVKPIICQKQIKEYSKFIKGLNNTNLLIIIGYKFNSEDNHINSIIGEWLRYKKDNTMIYFNYNNCLCFDKLIWLNEFKNKKQIINIEIGETNSTDNFEQILREIQKYSKSNEDNIICYEYILRNKKIKWKYI